MEKSCADQNVKSDLRIEMRQSNQVSPLQEVVYLCESQKATKYISGSWRLESKSPNAKCKVSKSEFVQLQSIVRVCNVDSQVGEEDCEGSAKKRLN